MSTPATTILVVEDEESFVDALIVGLQREGFRVQVARDGTRPTWPTTGMCSRARCSTVRRLPEQ